MIVEDGRSSRDNHFRQIGAGLYKPEFQAGALSQFQVDIGVCLWSVARIAHRNKIRPPYPQIGQDKASIRLSRQGFLDTCVGECYLYGGAW